MNKLVYMFLCAVLIKETQSLHSVDDGNTEEQKSLRKILEALTNTQLYITSGNRRAIDPLELAKAKNIFEAISASMTGKLLMDTEKALRGKPEPSAIQEFIEPVDKKHEDLIEQELHDAAYSQNSALLNQAHIEKKGRNDFLVLEDKAKELDTKFVPNDIYYNIEKKCVNWLDDCSLQGIRSKLLEKVRSPFKK